MELQKKGGKNEVTIINTMIYRQALLYSSLLSAARELLNNLSSVSLNSRVLLHYFFKTNDSDYLLLLNRFIQSSLYGMFMEKNFAFPFV